MSSAPSDGAPRFAGFDITGQIFYKTPLTIGLVNLKPISPGHVLVIPRRTEAKRLSDMRPDEVSDLFSSVQTVARVIEKVFRAQSLNIAIQDGPYAGQSVPHLHVHILPRHDGDFDPDQVYNALDTTDIAADFESAKAAFKSGEAGQINVDDAQRKPRSKEEMHMEAEMLAGHFEERYRP